MDTSPPARVPISAPSSRWQKPQRQINWVNPPNPNESGYDLFEDTEGRWVVYNWKPARQQPGARIEPFYQRWPPSQTSAETCAWICVDRGQPKASKARPEPKGRDLQGLRRGFQELVKTAKAADKNVTPEQIDLLAKKYNVLTGKWMIHSKSPQIDQLWRRVAGVVCFDRRRGQVKVSTREENDDSHVISVYADDYLNRDDVEVLRKMLRDRAGVTWKIGFKPDAYTFLGIYKGNAWNIRPSRYHDSDDAKA